jgi:hypothetical protein
MTYQGNNYGAIVDHFGFITIVRKSDGADVLLQGDDALYLREALAQLDTIEYPSGPFQTYESHLDVVLDQYDTVLTVTR